MTTNHVLEYNLVIMGSEIIIMFDTVNNDKVFTLFSSLLSMDSSLMKLGDHFPKHFPTSYEVCGPNVLFFLL